jgi:cell division protein FtsB
MKTTIFALIAVLAFLQYKLWFDEGGIKDVVALKKKVALEKSQLADKRMRNKKMAQNIQALKNNEEMVEYHARKGLGMTKRDESYYQILEK